jgi:predicted enzyme related to lactoylglutathione lyase
VATTNRLVSVALEVSDLERSARLYRDAFGIPLKPPADHEGEDRWISGAHAAHSWTDGTFLHISLYQSKGDVTRHAQLGISVPDLAVAHIAAVSAGAEVVHEPRDEPWGRSARYRDPDGNVIELTQLAAS